MFRLYFRGCVIEYLSRNYIVLDFMAALSDPRAFMGAAKERSDNMKSMGIEEAGGAGQPSGEQKKVKVEEKVEGM